VQQQLLRLAFQIEAAKAEIPPELDSPRQGLERIAEGLEATLQSVREISRGIHPAILSEAGLAPALRALGRRSAIPVQLELDGACRLPDSIEMAAYYVVSEALANIAKHADASVVAIVAKASPRLLRVTIRDHGVGGAEAQRGSGLTGSRIVSRRSAAASSSRVRRLGARPSRSSSPSPLVHPSRFGSVEPDPRSVDVRVGL
jgi:signal transduction histidine kinase